MLHFWREYKIIQASGGDKVQISLAVNPDYTVNVKANGSSISNARTQRPTLSQVQVAGETRAFQLVDINEAVVSRMTSCHVGEEVSENQSF